MPFLGWTRLLVLTLTIVALGVTESSFGAVAEELQGRWQVVAGNVDGKRIPSKGLAFYAIGDKEMKFSNGLQERKFEYTINASATPMEMDQVMEIDGESLVSRVIFKLDGDALLLCGSVLPGKPRPTEFVTRPGDELVLFELKRVASNDAALSALKQQPHFVGLKELGARFELDPSGEVRTVLLSTTPVTAEHLESLQKFPKLTALSLAVTGVGDKEMKLVSKLSRLERLNLSNTRVTDDGVKRLKALIRLQELQITGTTVSVEGLLGLKYLSKLRKVDVDEAAIGAEALARLKRVMSKCEFH